MFWFWIGFFALVALLLFIDLGVLNRKAHTPSIKSALYWTLGWMSLGLAFTGVVYLIYEHGWMGAQLKGSLPGASNGGDAAITYVSAYLLEQALSIDNIFVMSLLFTSFKIPEKYQHRVLFWGILGAIVFRVAMLGGGEFSSIQQDGGVKQIATPYDDKMAELSAKIDSTTVIVGGDAIREGYAAKMASGAAAASPSTVAPISQPRRSPTSAWPQANTASTPAPAARAPCRSAGMYALKCANSVPQPIAPSSVETA